MEGLPPKPGLSPGCVIQNLHNPESFKDIRFCTTSIDNHHLLLLPLLIIILNGSVLGLRKRIQIPYLIRFPASLFVSLGSLRKSDVNK